MTAPLNIRPGEHPFATDPDADRRDARRAHLWIGAALVIAILGGLGGWWWAANPSVPQLRGTLDPADVYVPPVGPRERTFASREVGEVRP